MDQEDYLLILDKNLNRIEKIYFKKDYINNSTAEINNIHPVDEITEDFLNDLDYPLGIFSVSLDSEELYLSFLNDSFLNFCPLNFNGFKGYHASELFCCENYSLLNIIKEVYNTGKSQELIGDYYINDILDKRFELKISKIHDFISITTKDKTDYFLLSMEEEKLFNNGVTAVGIIQDGRYVKCNDYFNKTFFLEKDPIGQKVGFSGFFDDYSYEWAIEHINRTLKNKSSTYTFPIEIKHENNISYYFNITFKYILYEGKPAVLGINNDVTKEELYRLKNEKNSEEMTLLKKYLDLMETATNAAITYQKYDKVTLSSNFYNIIERKPYPDDQNRTLTWDFVVDEDVPLVKEKYKILRKTGTVDFIMRIKTAKRNLKYIHAYYNGIYKNNKVRELIAVYKDVTDEQQYLKRLNSTLKESLTLQNNLEHTQKISKTAMCYVNQDGSITWTPSTWDIVKLDPKDYKDYTGTLINLIIDEDKNKVYELFNKCSLNNPEQITTFRIINGEGKLAYIKCYIVCDYDENGSYEGCIDYFMDITEQVEKENRLKELLSNSLMLERSIEKIQKISKTFLCYVDDKTNEITWFNKGYNLMNKLPKNSSEMQTHIFEEDKDLWYTERAKCTPENPEIFFLQRFILDNGELRYLETYSAQEFDNDGNKLSHVNLYQDVTDDVIKEQKLEATLNDKEVLLTEVHHRVKNNLQIIISLINLSKSFDSDPIRILNDTEHRIYTMALIHERVYESLSFYDVDMKNYIGSLVNSLLDEYENIQHHLNIDLIKLNMEEAMPIGLIVSELVTNTIRYAYPNNEEGNLYIEFKKIDKHYTLTVEDDGVGLSDDFDLNNLTSLGLMVVQNLTLQLGGTLSVMNTNGAGFKIEFDEE